MKHKAQGRKFDRKRDQRKALLRSLATNFIRDEKIITTEAKAKELRSYIEKLISAGRKGTLASQRVLASKLGEETVARKLVKEIAPKYSSRPGGYTRVTKLPQRSGDASKMALIELV